MDCDLVMAGFRALGEAWTMLLLSIVSGVLAGVFAVYPILLHAACKGNLESGTALVLRCGWFIAAADACTEAMVPRQAEWMYYHSIPAVQTASSRAAKTFNETESYILCLSLIHISEPTRPY